MIGCEVKACDLAASEAQNADQLTLVDHVRTQPADGVGVDVAGDVDLSPGGTSIFLM